MIHAIRKWIAPKEVEDKAQGDMEVKADTFEPAIQALIGKRPRPFQMFHEQRRPTLRALVQRDGRWVHRCLDINAGTAASVEPRLFAVGNKEITKKCLQFKPREIDVHTKAFFLGKCILQPGSVARKAIQGMTDDMVEITEHPILDLMNDINDFEEGYAFRFGQFWDLQCFGRLFTLLVGTGDQPEQLWRLLPHKIRIIPDPELFVKAFWYGTEPDKQIFEPSEILWHKMFDPIDPWGGKGPVEAWLMSIDADFAIAGFQQWLFERGGTPDYIIKHKAVMTDPQKRDFLTEWRRKFGVLPRRVTNIAFLQAKESWEGIERVGSTNRELEFSKSVLDKRDELIAAFGVSKAMITSDDVNRANAREASPTHMRYTIWPMIKRMEDFLNQRFLPLWSDQLILIHDNPIPEDQVLVIQNRESKLRSGYSINECRIAEGEPASEDPKANEPLIAAGLQLVSKLGEMPDFGSAFGGGGFGGGNPNGKPEDTPEDKKQYKWLLEKLAQLLPEGNLDGDIARDALRCIKDEDEPKKKALNDDVPRGTSGASDGNNNQNTNNNLSNDPVGRLANNFLSHKQLWYEYYVSTKLEPITDIPKQALLDLIRSQETFLHGQIGEIAIILEADGIHAAMVAMRDPKWRELLSQILRPHVELLIEEGAEAGLSRLPGGLSFSVESPDVIQFIEDYTVQLSDSINNTTAIQLRDIMNVGEDADRSIQAISSNIRQMDSEVTGFRAERIARTESARAYVEGERVAWRESGVVAGKKWLLAPGACQFCRALKAEIPGSIPLDQPFYPLGTLLTGVEGGRMKLNYQPVMGPPLHPNDRCDLLPVLIED